MTPSRESHEVRHCEKARQARSGRPRWKVEERRPKVISARARPKPVIPSQRSAGSIPVSEHRASQTMSP